jgi:hypothetical protein
VSNPYDELRLFGVGEELAVVGGIGDSPPETAQRFDLRVASGELAPAVSTACGIEASLADRGDVEHMVHPTVSSTGEPVPVLLSGGGIEGCGAGPGCEPVAVGEPCDVADVGQCPVATTGPTP